MTYRCETVELDPDASRFADLVEQSALAANTITPAERRWLEKVARRAKRREENAKP